MELLNENPVKVESEKELVTLLKGTLNNNKYTPIKQKG